MGDIPSARFGHGSAFAGSVVVVWGGDTVSASANQLRTRAKYDNALYFLNLVSREWTRVSVDGPAPAGRLGHTVVMIGPRVYVFGGQAHGEFLNDVWCFDLSTLISKPAWEQLDQPKGAPRPSRRSGHSCVAYKHKLIVFGGTDGRYHYNDVWAFDTRTRTWSEFWCTGYIPSPREGHGAALVDDVVYVFGGRGVDGGNIGELAAFRISNQRWYMFHNMGPEPAPRSGHGMVAVGSKVYVLGGVSEDDLDGTGKHANVAYVLETDLIKYPPVRRPLPPTPDMLAALSPLR
ncbi:galactose oxidase [Pilatotrama ljubarskyi]|nr:galactose oxidase [Pilatotrama ljubarskyi]